MVGEVTVSFFTSNISVQFVSKFDPVYPQNVSQGMRGVISIYLGIILCVGTYYRALIVDFLWDMNLKRHPVNILFWIIQMLEAMFACNIFAWMLASTASDPLAKALGTNFCLLLPLIGNIRITGSIIWNCITAVYRTMSHRVQLKHGQLMFKKRTVAVAVTIGIVMHVLTSYWIFKYDIASMSKTTCTRFPREFYIVLAHYQGPTYLGEDYTRLVLARLAFCGLILCSIEFLCYLFYFYEVWHHNNHVAIRIIKPTIIKNRNRASAVSILGQFGCWVMQVVYIIIIGILSPYSKNGFPEVIFFIKSIEYAFVPIFQVHTSGWIRQVLHFG